jgi:chitodextrinase
MKKKMHIYHRILAFFLLLLLIGILIGKKHVALFPNTGVSPYISTNGTNLIANGELYQFTGVNAYSLGTYPGSNAGCGGKEENLDAFFSKLRPNSIVRMWAFQGSITTNPTTKQTDWTGLDRVVAAAEKDGVKLDLVLGEQSGTCDDGHWKDKAWYAGDYTKAMNDYGNGLTPLSYLDYVKLIVSRYKDSTAIALWEPMNEPESSDCKGEKGSACYGHQVCTDEAESRQALRSFYDTVGVTIKSIDSNHLVSSGVIGGGQCGAQFEDYQYLHESPGIDVATYHDYENDDNPMPGDQYNGLQKRLNQMKLINKPLIVEEVGTKAMDNSINCMNLATRRDKLKAKMDAQFAVGIAGFMPWNVTDGVSTICNYDIGDNDPTIVLLHDYPVSMGSYTDTLAPTVPSNLASHSISQTQARLVWTASIDNVGVVRYDIFRNNTYFTSAVGTNVAITNLAPGTTYTFFVKGKDAKENNSGASKSISFTTVPDTQAPTSPLNLTVNSPEQVTLRWTPSVDDFGVLRYDIFRNDTYYTSTTGTSITVSNLAPSTTNVFFIKSKDIAGNNSVSSNRVTVK